MIVVENCIISEDIRDVKFCCNLQKCKGMCCVEGDAGAPLEKNEVKLLKKLLPKIKPYLTEKGLKEIENYGVSDLDVTGELCTRIIDDKDCVFLIYENDIAKCAIEKAYEEGKIDFQKPISCHLYPIRVQNYGEFSALNYHAWDICKSALIEGKERNVPLYIMLKVPLIRKFGEKWYDELISQIENK
ncbi:hypothetical protein SDC9_25490 [bioreactor metagenome]|uniref:DUF3109 domain-containing protein n=1 Tax=bioreactor metagenome TaxID=1076179 RepID=A0A644UKN5_9ZZZZ